MADSHETKQQYREGSKRKRFGRYFPVTLRLALRNLFAHRSKTLIIGTLVALGIMILITGNSMIDTADAGIRMNYIDSFTGDLMIREKAEGSFSLFTTDINMAMRDDGLPTIADYGKIYSYITSLAGVKAVAPQLVGRGVIVRDERFLRMLLLFGIDPETYSETFPDNLEIVKGAFLKEGEDGILISENAASSLLKKDKYAPAIGDSILLAGFSFNGFGLREVTLRGIFKYKNSNELLDTVSLVDAGTMRAMLDMSDGSGSAIGINPEDSGLMDTTDTDDLFSTVNIVTETKASTKDPLSLLAGGERAIKTITADSNAESGLWHFPSSGSAMKEPRQR
jgi:putative ABC transport system permease protein